jgi:hypothetical protein
MRKGFTRKPQGDEPATRGKNYITPSGLQRLKDEHRLRTLTLVVLPLEASESQAPTFRSIASGKLRPP